MIGWLGNGAVLNTSSSSSVSGGGGLNGTPSWGKGGRGGAWSGQYKSIILIKNHFTGYTFIFKTVSWSLFRNLKKY